jgi:hypothetical protein
MPKLNLASVIQMLTFTRDIAQLRVSRHYTICPSRNIVIRPMVSRLTRDRPRVTPRDRNPFKPSVCP